MTFSAIFWNKISQTGHFVLLNPAGRPSHGGPRGGVLSGAARRTAVLHRGPPDRGPQGEMPGCVDHPSGSRVSSRPTPPPPREWAGRTGGRMRCRGVPPPSPEVPASDRPVLPAPRHRGPHRRPRRRHVLRPGRCWGATVPSRHSGYIHTTPIVNDVLHYIIAGVATLLLSHKTHKYHPQFIIIAINTTVLFPFQYFFLNFSLTHFFSLKPQTRPNVSKNENS